MLDSLNKTFSENPVSLDMSRSQFSMNQTHKTTFSEGDLVPVYFREVLPGDTFQLDTSFLLRMATPIFPVMDNAFLDAYYFYVPNRLVWKHWKEFMGENTSGPWAQTVKYQIPQLSFSTWTDKKTGYFGFGPRKNSVMNYLGIPTSMSPVFVNSGGPGGLADVQDLQVSDLPNRAYRLIWNEFFRDQNLQSPVPVYDDDSIRVCLDSFNEGIDPGDDYGGRPLKVSKFHDYFTSCLPAPQKGPSVFLNFENQFAPVRALSQYQDFLWKSSGFLGDNNTSALHYAVSPLSSSSWDHDFSSGNALVGTSSSNNKARRASVTGSTIQIGDNELTPDNLYADFTGLTVASVNQLRDAFAVQRIYEAFARGGTRYREILKSIFSVTAPDFRVQVPEYLGGDRFPINMDQVLQTSSTDSVSPQGNTAGYSLTTSVDHSFTKSFVEHGMIIGLVCVRVEHTYAQGIEPYWFRKNLFDFYFPQLANLSEQPVFKKNLFCTGLSQYDDTVFGYQEAWADYRFAPNRLSGDFSPDSYVIPSDDSGTVVYKNSELASAWSYNDFYGLGLLSDTVSYMSGYDNYAGDIDFDKLPYLSAGWISEDVTNIGQTLAVPDYPQFIADFRFNVIATRPMPVRSVPGLIDHH